MTKIANPQPQSPRPMVLSGAVSPKPLPQVKFPKPTITAGVVPPKPVPTVSPTTLPPLAGKVLPPPAKKGPSKILLASLAAAVITTLTAIALRIKAHNQSKTEGK